MKRLLALPLLLLPLFVYAGEIVEVGISGVACPSCVYGLQMSLNKLDGVKEATVSYEGQNCRVEMIDGEVADIELIKNTIIRSGITPGEATKIN